MTLMHFIGFLIGFSLSTLAINAVTVREFLGRVYEWGRSKIRYKIVEYREDAKTFFYVHRYLWFIRLPNHADSGPYCSKTGDETSREHALYCARRYGVFQHKFEPRYRIAVHSAQAPGGEE